MDKRFGVNEAFESKGVFDLDEEDISIIKSMGQNKSGVQSKEQEMRAKRGTSNRSKNLTAFKKGRFAEDETCLLEEHRKKNSVLKMFRPKIQSNDETESAREEFVGGVSNILDDTSRVASARQRTSFLNVLVLGESKTCKLEFIKYMFEHVFREILPACNPAEKVNEYTHSFDVRRQKRVITLAHAQGHDPTYSISKWYKTVKKYIRERMDTYDSLCKMSISCKGEQPIDTRIHLILYFVKSPKVGLTEIGYMRKLQKCGCIVPVIVEKSSEARISFEYVKALKTSLKRTLDRNEVERLLFSEDVALHQIQDTSLAGTLPFFVLAPNGILSPKAVLSDLSPLIQLIRTPYINSYYYKTEVIFNKYIQKLSSKIMNGRKSTDGKTRESGDNKSGFGYGLAFGIGFLSALVAIKKTVF